MCPSGGPAGLHCTSLLIVQSIIEVIAECQYLQGASQNHFVQPTIETPAKYRCLQGAGQDPRPTWRKRLERR